MRQTGHAAILAVALLAMPLNAGSQDLPPPKAGTFHIDRGHSRLLFQVNHLGYSHYTALFTDFDATLKFDPENPGAMSMTATVAIGSLETHYPDPALDFNAIITGADLLDKAQFPTAGFVSTNIKVTGANTADVTGDLTLHGMTKPVVLSVTYNGGYGAFPMDPGGARIGFSARAAFKRSDFGIDLGIPEPGTTMGVSDRVDIILEAEFLNPDAKAP
jgi:polyisoprenoid-binding protein YceI